MRRPGGGRGGTGGDGGGVRTVGKLARERARAHPLVGEPVAHDWRVGDLAEHVAEAAKGVPHEDVVVGQPALRVIVIVRADHEDLGERPGGALPELVVRVHGDIVVHHRARVLAVADGAVEEEGVLAT